MTYLHIFFSVGFFLLITNLKQNEQNILLSIVSLLAFFPTYILWRKNIYSNRDLKKFLIAKGFEGKLTKFNQDNKSIRSHFFPYLPVFLQKILQWNTYSEQMLTIQVQLEDKDLRCEPTSIKHNVNIPFHEDGYLYGRQHKQGELNNVSDAKIREAIEKTLKNLDYLDINLEITNGELIIDVYGSEFLGEYLRKNIENTFVFMEDLLKELGEG